MLWLLAGVHSVQVKSIPNSPFGETTDFHGGAAELSPGGSDQWRLCPVHAGIVDELVK